MRKLKKIMAIVLSLLFFITLVQTKGSNTKAETTDTVYVKIRYNRQDKDYEGWNLWVWEKDKDGKQADFIGEDEDGRFAVIKTSKEAGSLGFILRKNVNGNDWAENYFGTDKTVDLNSGDKEIVINNEEDTSKRTSEVKNLNKEFNKVTLNLHYYRFDKNYSGWDVWSWIDSTVKDNPIKAGSGYNFSGEDSFGKVAKIEMENVKSINNRKVSKKGIGVIVRRQDWSEKDGDNDKFVNLAYANKNGVINAYLVQGNPEIQFREKDCVRNLKVTKATIDGENEINFETNVKLPKDLKKDVMVKENGNPLAGLETVPTSDNSAKITTTSKVDSSKQYTLSIKGYPEEVITLGKVLASNEFANKYTYDGKLGAVYEKDKTTFVLWAPIASEVKLALYDDGDTSKVNEIKTMTKGEKGTWTISLNGDLKGTYYNYFVTNYNKESEVTDPYAKAVGVNGKRGMVVDLDKTNPKGWDSDVKPELKDPTDAVIYEMHIRDFTEDASSGASLEVMGKYKGVWQSGTSLFGKGDVKTGVDHLKELGVTHVHILPGFDTNSIDESKLNTPQFNWGYDPLNYNVPEGSYSSNPYKAEIRINEFKEMVKELHKAGIRVVMDMVYNHTAVTEGSNLNLAVPGYYYRQNADGSFSNGSGCGNETASERSMVRKLILDSVLYWAKEYHIDGFRFDLMALHDIDTIKIIRQELNKIDKSILVYGEGWTGGDSPLSDDKKALKANMHKFDEYQIAAFSDDMRDGIKGHVFEAETPGFVNGFKGLEDVIKFGIAASTKHDGISYKGGPNEYSGYGKKPWANEPYQTINYTSAHDNLTLWDKLQTTNPKASKEELVQMNKMAAALVLTSQGIPFFQAGEEMARTKVKEDGTFDDNSFKSPDSINSLKWNRKVEYSDLFNYYKGLINLRKAHKAFRMNSSEELQKNLEFLEKDKNFAEDNVVAYTLNGKAVNDSFDKIAVVFNANNSAVKVTLPSKDWILIVNEKVAGTSKLAEIKEGEVTIPAKASYVLVDSDSFNKNNSESENKKNSKVAENTNGDSSLEKTSQEINDVKNNEEVKTNKVKTYDNNLLMIFEILGLASLAGVIITKRKNTI